MNNITYNITEPNTDGNNTDDSSSDLDSELLIMSSSHSSSNSSIKWTDIDLNNEQKIKVCKYSHPNSNNSIVNEAVARQVDYDINYTAKYISSIMDFYEIKKNKLNKKEMIDKIVEFEQQVDNCLIVERRKRLFDNFIELKNDKFFKKFIIGSL